MQLVQDWLGGNSRCLLSRAFALGKHDSIIAPSFFGPEII